MTIAALTRAAIAIEDEAEKQLNPSAFRQAVQARAPQVVGNSINPIPNGMIGYEKVAIDMAETAQQMEDDGFDSIADEIKF